MTETDTVKVAIVGYGNVGRGVHAAMAWNPDMSLVGIITRRPEQVRKEAPDVAVHDAGSPVRVDWATELPVDVAILCGGSKSDLPEQGPRFVEHFNTVDSLDTALRVPEYCAQMDRAAKAHGNVAICAAGWDPGFFSIERALADAFVPGSKAHTFWGPGVSQGHTNAVRQIEGVQDAIQYTIPIDEAVQRVRADENPDLAGGEKHWRDCYVVAGPGADPEKIAREIRTMRDFFVGYDTKVTFVSQDEMDERRARMAHCGFVRSCGTTGQGNRALIEHRCDWESNPEATGSILTACARAAYRFSKEGRSGAFTMLDVPPAYFSARSRQELLGELM